MLFGQPLLLVMVDLNVQNYTTDFAKPCVA